MSYEADPDDYHDRWVDEQIERAESAGRTFPTLARPSATANSADRPSTARHEVRHEGNALGPL
ncbi:hypothetical protein [Nocardia terpenica]|uniref:hypothetical protein n=1 Tax=Nocardia terpenica TaxID=455432 RepID=UPI0002DFE878|nr:hypothetical protein [Nocardia terpenica]NQE86299.1 hypothetical protein [Nocardia terpenica]